MPNCNSVVNVKIWAYISQGHKNLTNIMGFIAIINRGNYFWIWVWYKVDKYIYIYGFVWQIGAKIIMQFFVLNLPIRMGFFFFASFV